MDKVPVKGLRKVYKTVKIEDILVPCSGNNKVSQTEWLKTTDIYSFLVMEAESKKCWQGQALSNCVRGKSFFAFK